MKRNKNTAGFTLVELIVVIAILGILAGVGTVGYSGYVKNANKKADMVLVGNIMRAIETGTYSTMFTPSDSMAISATTFPVGFVTLSTDGANLLTSGTTISTVEGACEFVELENAYEVVSTSVSFDCTSFLCNETVNGTRYTVTSHGTMKYCRTHSNFVTEAVTNKEYHSTTGISHKSGSNNDEKTTETATVTGNVVSGDVYLASTNNSSVCEFAHANQNGIFTGSNVVNGAHGNAIDESHPLYGAIYAAYGSFDTLKLKYDGWTSEEGIEYATFYTAAPGVMSSIETLSGVLAWASTSTLFSGLVEGEYENGEEVLSGITDKVLSTHTTQDAWLTVWNSAGDKTWDSYGFGLTGRENYSAARMAYNSGFAAYLMANGIDSTYADVVKNFNAQEMAGVGLPGLVCTDAFTDSECKLKDKFASAGDSDGSVFEACAVLFEQYKGSEACAENGRVFYNTMVTFDETEQFATDENNIYGGDMFDYYNAYVNEIAALYGAAQESAGDGIVIIVNVENGVVNCNVSPSAANPRNAA